MSRKRDKRKTDGTHPEEIIGQVSTQDLGVTGFEVVEEGIRSLVVVLWERGYNTVCSCAGHIGGLEPLPWITILVNEADPWSLLRLNQAVGRFNLSQGENGMLPETAVTWVLSPQITQGGLAVYLRPQSLNERRDRKEILRLREIGEKLAKFIQLHCRDLFPLC